MSEETWYKMLAVSFALHILVIGAFSIPFKSKPKEELIYPLHIP